MERFYTGGIVLGLLAAAAAPAAVPENDEGSIVFLSLLILGMGFVMWRMHVGLWKQIDKRIASAVMRLETELPPLLAPVEMVKAEMREFRKRLQQIEAQADNLQRQVDGEKQRS